MIKFLTYPLNSLSIIAIKVYKKTKRRKYDKCLHYPSCSNYGIIAFKKYNFFVAVWKTVNRIRNCNPFSNKPFIDYP